MRLPCGAPVCALTGREGLPLAEHNRSVKSAPTDNPGGLTRARAGFGGEVTTPGHFQQNFEMALQAGTQMRARFRRYATEPPTSGWSADVGRLRGWRVTDDEGVGAEADDPVARDCSRL